MKKNNKGFTLVELIVVIAILGVLMAVLVPQYIQYVEKSKVATDESALGEVIHAAEISLAELDVNNAVSKMATCYLTVGDDADIVGVSTGAGAETDAGTLVAAVKKVVSKVDFKSKTYQGKSYCVEIDTVNMTVKAYAAPGTAAAATGKNGWNFAKAS